ncbi:MAG: heavy metal-associated domain-containing protein [Bacteroidota bacterium]|nr:heavy metal-associated domain-containing protein [Bacteroidota bacterium]
MKKMIVLLTLVFSISLFSAEKSKTVILNVSGMTCESCVGTVEKALKKVDGVKEVKVDLKNKKATVTLASTTTSATLIKAVSDAGFSANEGKTASKTDVKKKSKSGDEDCSDGCCGDESKMDGRPMKSKKSDAKKS